MLMPFERLWLKPTPYRGYEDDMARELKPAGPWLDWSGVIARLRASVNASGGQSAWAEKHGISPQYVCDVLGGRRLPGNKITKALGLEKALLWRTPSQ